MKKEGNADVDVCVLNLLKTFKTEVPYSREKGIDSKILDSPINEIEVEMIEQAENVIQDYEDRVDIDDVTIDAALENGEIKYSVEIAQNEEV